ncbi:PI-PLC X domain-containing protein At5g67130 [Lolium perenne]|uniref:PI-PLC X domain-containing protein At5g67130 n=1 Tax=Lolium perenne TaxID=4522 RepID=UPI0021F59352|nr:PI-PLC X domain-containing protein At5g67130-like [Lolium perenne]
MHSPGSTFLLLCVMFQAAAACSGGQCELGDRCSSSADCGNELYCYNCWVEFAGKRCVRKTVSDPFKIVDTSLPFNKYAFLTTHNSFSIHGEPSHTGVPRITLYNQEDSVTDQLNNGVRALMLDVYDFRDEVWLCHSKGGKCFDFTAFEPAVDTMREIEAFLSSHPSAIVTLILEDYVGADHGLSKLFNSTGLTKYWFPVSSMPRHGEDWPRVRDMIARNHRLLVFTSDESKESTEGIAYQWNFMVENQYGDGGMSSRSCHSRSESLAMGNRTRSLVLVNYFHTVPLGVTECAEHSLGLAGVLRACHAAAGNRWANFLAVDYYKRSDGGGVFEATDMLNGMLICGRDDVRACRRRTLKDALQGLLGKLGLMPGRRGARRT